MKKSEISNDTDGTFPGRVAEKPVYRTFDDMCWPCPSERLSDLAWVLTWGLPTKGDHLLAAAVIGAYCQMIGDPAKHRQRVIAELRQGPNLPRKRPESKPASRDATTQGGSSPKQSDRIEGERS